MVPVHHAKKIRTYIVVIRARLIKNTLFVLAVEKKVLEKIEQVLAYTDKSRGVSGVDGD